MARRLNFSIKWHRKESIPTIEQRIKQMARRNFFWSRLYDPWCGNRPNLHGMFGGLLLTILLHSFNHSRSHWDSSKIFLHLSLYLRYETEPTLLGTNWNEVSWYCNSLLTIRSDVVVLAAEDELADEEHAEVDAAPWDVDITTWFQLTIRWCWLLLLLLPLLGLVMFTNEEENEVENKNSAFPVTATGQVAMVVEVSLRSWFLSTHRLQTTKPVVKGQLFQRLHNQIWFNGE